MSVYQCNIDSFAGTQISALNPMPVSLPLNVDAFYRLRFSEPATIFDSKQIADTQGLFWDDQETSGGGTGTAYNTNQASTTISVSNTTAGTRTRQTFRRFNYQPGKSQLFIITGIVGTAATGITRRLGLFDDNNGLFFEQTAAGMAVVVRSYTTGSAVNNSIAQASWNIDTMDGTGASGITLDFSKTLIYFADFEWLGVGTVRFGVFVNGRPYYVHAEHHSNIASVVYMSTPNLPIRYEIDNDGTGAAASLTHICCTVITEGGRQETGIRGAVDRGITGLTTGNDTNIYPLIAVRLKSTHLGSLINFLNYQIICTSTSNYRHSLLLNPTVAGTALSFSALSNYSVEYALPTNATTVSGGTPLNSGYGSDTNQNVSGVQANEDSDLTIGSKIDGTADIVVLAVQNIAAGAETYFASLNFNDTF